MIEHRTYDLKAEFFPLLGITEHQYKRRKGELLEWLGEFFKFELNEATRPMQITIFEQYDEYEPLPRDTKEQRKKKKDYEEFTINSLSAEFEYNSKSRVAREAIKEFGKVRYGHESTRSVVNRYVGPAMNEFGETNKKYAWCWYSTYKPLNDEELDKWHQLLKKYKIEEEQAANAFYKQERGEDISEEKAAFKNALDEMKMLYFDCPVRVAQWKLKTE